MCLAAKRAVYRLIRSEIGYLLSPALYPEVIDHSEGTVSFQNRATANFVKEILNM
jgi:hypothetical protein